MSRKLVIIVGLILTAACMLLYVFEPAFLKRIANITYDTLLPQEGHKSGKVVLVDIDEASLKRFQQWPWPRFYMAELTRQLRKAGAKVVAFDIIFAEPDRTSPRHLRQLLREHFNVDVSMNQVPADIADFDLIFAKALAEGHTVLGCYMDGIGCVTTNEVWPADPNYHGYFVSSARGRDCPPLANHLFQATNIIVSIPTLNTNAGNNAFINVEPDLDNIIRSAPLAWALGPSRIYPSLALEAVRMYLDVPQVRIVYDPDGIQYLGLRDKQVPTDFSGRLVINYRKPIEAYEHSGDSGGFTTFPSLSAASVIDGQFPSSAVSNKIVFIGTSVVGLRDIRTTPFSASFAGVEINATIADNILAGDMLLNPAWSQKNVEIWFIFLIGLFLTFMIHRGKSWLSFLVIALVILSLILTSQFLMRSYHFVFVPSWIIVSALLIYVILTVIKFWQEEWQKHWVRNLFGSMVSPEVLRYMEHNPRGLALRGVRTEATMMFADIVEFTQIAESLPPERLSQLLNDFFSPMTNIILKRQGYVDKYEGDLIMADWGVPFPLPDHARLACLAALELQTTLAELRPRFKRDYGYELFVRVGVNSGTVTAGNMGSDQKFQYTVIGDAVNQASRLETANKEYGTSILVGESTWQSVREIIACRRIDRLMMKGRSQPVLIYEIMGSADTLPPARRMLAAAYEEALDHYWMRRWTEALVRIEAALAIDPADGPSQLLKRRIIIFKQSPPPDDWNGAFARDRKI